MYFQMEDRLYMQISRYAAAKIIKAVKSLIDIDEEGFQRAAMSFIISYQALFLSSGSLPVPT